MRCTEGMLVLFGGILMFGFGCSESEKITGLREELLELKQDVQIVKDLAKEFQEFMSLMRTIHRRELAELSESMEYPDPVSTMLNDTTIEERVTILEFQVESLNDDVTLLNSGVADLGEEIDVIDGEIAVIFADQVLQNERILELESDSDTFSESISSLESTDEYLNSAVMSVNVTLTEDVADLDVQVMNLDERVSGLEATESFAFHVNLREETVPAETVIVYGDVKLNLGNGYDNTTGQFTVPSGGAGLYYFNVHGTVAETESAGIAIRQNGEDLCIAHGNDVSTYSTSACGAATLLDEGDVVDAWMWYTTDDTPFHVDSYPYNTFTGIRIASQ